MASQKSAPVGSNPGRRNEKLDHMSSLSSFFNPEYDSEDMQKLVERMARARWVERAFVTPDPVSIVWSAKGKKRLAEVVQVLRRYAPGLFNGTGKRNGIVARLVMLFRVFKISSELQPPRLSMLEVKCLLILATHIGRENDPARREAAPESQRRRF
jgi:hypothetical protein